MSVDLKQDIPDGYKQTEVGVIPQDWSVKQISDVFEICNTLRFPLSSQMRESMAGEYPYYGPTKIQDYINEYRIEGEYALIGEDGDHFLKFETTPQTQLARGKFNVNNHAHVIKGKNALTEWFYLYFKHREISSHLSRQGAGRYKLNKATLEKLLCAIPPKKEQTAIANALFDVDALMSELENLIAKKQAIKTATMQQLLTGKTRLPQFAFYSDINSAEGTVEGKRKHSLATNVNVGACDDGYLASQESVGMNSRRKGTKPSELGEIPEDWEVVNLGEIISFKNGAAHEDCVDEYGNFVLVNSKFVSTEGQVRKGASECRQAASNNDLLMVMSDVPNGKAIAKCFLVDQDNLYTVNQRICILKPLDEMNPIFLLKVLSRNPYYLAFDDGAKQTNLRRQDVLSCPLVKPSKEEQTAIATILSDMDNEIQTLEQRLSKTRQIKQGMMQELLTGKTRLPFGKDITSEVSV